MPYNQPGGTHNGGYGTAGGGRSGGNGSKGVSRPAPRTSQLASQAAAIAGQNPMANNRAAQVDSFFSGARGYGNTDFSKAVKDFQDQGIANKALDFFTGVHELNPVDAWNGTPNASWGIDPLGAGLSLAGTALGAPLGTAYSALKGLIGFKGPQLAFSGSPTAYSDYGIPGGLNTASGAPQAPQGGGTGNNAQAAQIAQNGPMTPRPGQVTPATQATQATPLASQSMGPMQLSVPGPSQYGLMLPGYRWG